MSSRHTKHRHKGKLLKAINNYIIFFFYIILIILIPGKNEWLGETNHFNIQLTSLCVALLHDDILAVCPETDIITQCSLNEMRKISHQYLMAVQNTDIIKDYDKITKSLERNHLKLVATNVILEGDEKTNETVKDVNIIASGSDVLLMEVLVESMEEPTQYIPVKCFSYY